MAAKNVLKVLIVEDQPERQEVFKNLYRDHAWIMVHTARRAIRLIEHYRFDLISLDYDLAGPLKGGEIAKHIQASKNHRSMVVIHSMNHPGAQRIQKVLPHALHIPFSRIIRNNAAFKHLREDLGEHGAVRPWKRYAKGNDA